MSNANVGETAQANQYLQVNSQEQPEEEQYDDSDPQQNRRGSSNQAGADSFGKFERRMPLKDKLSLGPIQKYTIYNRFPYKLILHILLVIMTSMLMVAQVEPNQLMLRSQQYVWLRKFLKNEDDGEVPLMDDFSRVKLLFTTRELANFTDVSLQNYYAMFNNTGEFENYKFHNEAEMYEVFVDHKNVKPVTTVIPEVDGVITHPLSEKTDAQIREWMEDIKEFQLRYNDVEILFPADSERDVGCYIWNITQRFYHSEAAQIRIELDLRVNTCSEFDDFSNFWWLNVMTMIIALISFVLDLNYVLEIINTMSQLRMTFEKTEPSEEELADDSSLSERSLSKIVQANEKSSQKQGIFKRSLSSVASMYNRKKRVDSINEVELKAVKVNQDLEQRKEKLKQQANWNDLLFKHKLKLIDKWTVISIFANVVQIIGSTYSIFRNNLNIQTADKALGIGCMLAWIIMLRYLGKAETYNDMISAWVKAAPAIGAALVSTIPLFIGYAFLGMSIFWESRRFATFSRSCFTLFSLMHADMMWDTYSDMFQVDAVNAQIYLYSYIFVSVCVIANVFTIIIEEGFMKQKYDTDYNWLLNNTRQHIGNEEKDKQAEDEDKEKPEHGHEKEFDGINPDSDVIVSEYRLLYLKYKEDIKLYREAIANLSLKQIINNEEEAWIHHKEKHYLAQQQKNKATSNHLDYKTILPKSSSASIFQKQVDTAEQARTEQQSKRAVNQMSTNEFDSEIQALSEQLRDKVASLKKDYMDLKLFQNEADIASARNKLKVFLKYLVIDTQNLVTQIQKDLDRNKKVMKKIETRMDQIEIDRLNHGSDEEDSEEEAKFN